jgi:hypothetical protein
MKRVNNSTILLFLLLSTLPGFSNPNGQVKPDLAT